ncbi:hypothetical protein RHGRI_031433 [Rhododendron griersonianum]|uniref:Uncharacterized protein n=1 Tax=Rhododendron griersonianum TaxID=479676 RepID=A0AAV6I897_9ERIC|nr:hypothetical protein RHGRI_031433 [Rhododendron griersonianum]
MMKRGKDDEKTMEPMFPRLHGDDHQKSPMYPLLHLNHSTHPAEELYSGYSNYKSSSTQVEQKRKLVEEDFTVPIFFQSEIGQDHRKHSNGMDREELSSFSPTYSSSMEVQNSSDREPKRARSQLHNSMCENDVSNEHVRGVGNGLQSNPGKDSFPEELESPNSSPSDSVCHEDETCESLIRGNGDRSDDASEISMVDSITGLDICPDDVVGVIGQKHFWKARREIVNQQRVFAVQVFELHRLIKVQRSFAGSPHLLVEDGAYLGKPSKGSFAKKLSLEFIKPSPNTVKHKDDSNKPSHNMECSAANADGKTSFSSVQNECQASSYKPLSTPFVSDAKTSPWGFHQPPSQQWLIPVMSPSEGLIYKPYNPGHGFMSPLCGGCGLPPGTNPMMGNFVNPAYCVPSSHHPYQGFGVPPYGMPFVDGAISNVVKPRATKERSELQGISTASSPTVGARGITVSPTTGGRNALPHFLTSQAVHVPVEAPQLHVTDKLARVIKVVPRNAMSATESVARIFQSIQEGRKQGDSV